MPSPFKKPQRGQSAVSASSVRIIGGVWKRSLLPVIRIAGLRPTPDRVRETVFNWLQYLFQGEWRAIRCVDLFAGSGALGFEAASRGVLQATLIETAPAAVAQLRANQARLKNDQNDRTHPNPNSAAADSIQILQTDALIFLHQQAAASVDLIFADPPYGQEWLVKIFGQCERVLRPGGWLYVEAEFAVDEAFLAQHQAHAFEIRRSARAGAVHYHLLQLKRLE